MHGKPTMQTTEFIWLNGSVIAWQEAKIHVLTHALHYGGGAFEGIRFYKTDRGPAVFRLGEHMDRLAYSAGALQMELPYTPDELAKAVCELISKNKMDAGYVRPIAYFGYGVMGLNPRNAPIEVAIACWPWGAYLPHESVDIKTSKYIRIHPRSTVADAKICGHYVNSTLAVLELKGSRYHEALFLDADGNIAEGPGENFFIVKDGVIYTPPLGTILAGITRRTVLEIAPQLGYRVEERHIRLPEAYKADEAFFTGTAAEVTPINSIDDQVLGGGGVGPVSRKIRDLYQDIVHGRSAQHDRYLSYVNA